MAEYIDREKALKFLENSLNFSKTELNTAHEEFQKGCISAIEDDIGNISHMPTEDVVPKSEVEYYIKIMFEAELIKAKQEAYEEIFDLIKQYKQKWASGEVVPYRFINELKKKYIGE